MKLNFLNNSAKYFLISVTIEMTGIEYVISLVKLKSVSYLLTITISSSVVRQIL